jgi:hypothetical protein
VLRIRIPDQESDAFFDHWIWDPGWVKVEIRISDEHPGSYFRELRNSFLVENTSILLWGSGSGIRNLLTLDPGSEIRDGKIRIRDKHPKSATLNFFSVIPQTKR